MILEHFSNKRSNLFEQYFDFYQVFLSPTSSVAKSYLKTILCCPGPFLLFQLSQLIVNAGGVAAVIDCLESCRGNIRLPGIMMLGYVAAHSENLAMAVIISKVGACFISPNIVVGRSESAIGCHQTGNVTGHSERIA